MRINLKKITLVVVACLLTAQTNYVFAQTNKYNNADWPDSPQKQERLKQSVDMLRSAVDTNQLAIIEKQLINELQPTNRTKTDNGSETITIDTGADMILCFHNFSKQMVSDLNEFADLLTDPKLETYSYGWGKAEIFSPHKNEGKVKFSFRSKGPILSGSRTTSDGEFELVHAQFGFDGKLSYFATCCREPEPFWFAKASFENNGQPDQLDSFSSIINNQLQFVFFQDRTGKLRFRINHLEKPVHQRM